MDSRQRTLALTLCLAALGYTFSSPPSLLAPPPPRGYWEIPGETVQLTALVIQEPWQGVSKPPSVSSQSKFHWIGHYPGFAAEKDKANRKKKEIREGSTSLPLGLTPNRPLLQTASSSVVLNGPSESDTHEIPPDPVIASGPNQVVVLVNSLIAIYNKTGVQQGSFQSFPSFFSSLGLNGLYSDPRIVYDPNDGRFILSVVDLDIKNLTFGDVLVAVSQTSDPTGVWYKFAINFKGKSPIDGANTYPDFPTLGISSTAIYISTGQFELDANCLAAGNCSFSDTWVRAIGLPALLAGSSTLSVTTFQNVKTGTDIPAFAVEPAITLGASSDEFLVAASFGSDPSSTLNLFSVNTTGTPTLSESDLTVPSFKMPPGANQAGTAQLIATNDFRLLNAVWSAGELWCANNVLASDNMSVAARWFEINATTLASASLHQSGTIAGAGEAYFPAVSVNSAGDMAVSFTTSSSFEYASAAFTGRASADPAGTTRGLSLYKAGAGIYSDFDLRWGDYSGMALDPDGTTFWAFAEYASSPNPNFGTAGVEITALPDLSLSAGILSFGQEVVNTTSAPQSLTLTNNSASATLVGTFSVTGDAATDFLIGSDGCSGTTLAAGQSCKVALTFQPTTTGTRQAALSLSSATEPFFPAVMLVGFGIPPNGALIASPGSLIFPDTPIRGASGPQTVVITNTGTTAEGVEVSSGNLQFPEINNCGVSLAAGSSCQVTVTFRPSYTGTQSAQLGIAAAPTPGTVVQTIIVDLSGNAIEAPAATLCPTNLSFGSQAIGTTSPGQPIILTNTGSSPLSITGIATSGDFAQSNNCGGAGATLSALAECVVTVTFTPTASGTRTGTLTTTDNASGSPQTVALTGTGPAATAAPIPALTLPELISSAEHPAAPTAAHASMTQVRKPSAVEYGRLPLRFESNLGQAAPDVKYLERGQGYTLFLTGDEAVLSLRSQKREAKREGRKSRPSSVVSGQLQKIHATNYGVQTMNVLRMKLEGANGDAKTIPLDPLPGKSNYFIGRDPSKWRTNVPNYARVEMEDIYPGIDLVYHGTGGEHIGAQPEAQRLEYDFVVNPGADPEKILLAFEEVRSRPRIARNGDLVISTAAGKVRFTKPIAYQPVGLGSGDHIFDSKIRDSKKVDGKFELRREGRVGFEVGKYDRSRPLVIDPTLSYSTYLGGRSQDYGLAIAVDSTGSAVVAGWTDSNNFPTFNPLQPQLNQNGFATGISDAFVSKLSPDGKSLVFSTYLGGSNGDAAYGIALDSAGNIYLTGGTSSSDFPVTTGVIQTKLNGTNDTFVAKLSADGSKLLYSTLLGGSAGDATNAIAVDTSGEAIVVGETSSPDFPVTPGAFQMTGLAASNGGNGFVSKLNSTASGLAFSTYLSGTEGQFVSAIALDSAGDVYAAGTTASVDFPTTPNAYQTGSAGGGTTGEGFVAKFDPAGNVLFSTYINGVSISSIALDSAGDAYLTGQAGSNFPTTSGAFQTAPFSDSPQNFSGTYVAKLHPGGCGLVSSTLFGGFWLTFGTAIAVDSSGNAYITGGTFDFGLPTVNAFQASCSACGRLGDTYESFVAKFSPDGSRLLYSSFLAGSANDFNYDDDQGNGIAVDTAGNAYVTGQTFDSDFPTLNALQPSYGGQIDGYVTKISPVNVPSLAMSPLRLSFPDQVVGTTSPPQSMTVTNQSANTVSISGISIFGGGTSFSQTNNCGASLAAGASCAVNVQFTPPETAPWTAVVLIQDSAFGGPHAIPLVGTGISGPVVTIVSSEITNGVLTFGATPIGTTLGPGVVGIDNTGDQSLVFSKIAISGDYSETDDCNSSLAPAGGMCSISITFKPTAGGTRTGTLTLTDNAADSPQTIPITGVAQDFALSSNPTTATVAAGGTANYTVSISPQGGFNQAVSLTCSLPPTLTYSTCAVSPMTVTSDATNAVTTMIRISTTAPTEAAPRQLPLSPWANRYGPLLALFALLVLEALRIRRQKPEGLSGPVICRHFGVVLAAALLAFLLIACGGGGSGVTHSPGTPAGNYTITFTGADTQSTPTLSHSTAVDLTVNP